MAYDVMIASAMADKAKAELVAKRLRSLKFRVRYDAKREHTTPTTRDLNDANRSGAVLVLWSRMMVTRSAHLCQRRAMRWEVQRIGRSGASAHSRSWP